MPVNWRQQFRVAAAFIYGYNRHYIVTGTTQTAIFPWFKKEEWKIGETEVVIFRRSFFVPLRAQTHTHRHTHRHTDTHTHARARARTHSRTNTGHIEVCVVARAYAHTYKRPLMPVLYLIFTPNYFFFLSNFSSLCLWRAARQFELQKKMDTESVAASNFANVPFPNFPTIIIWENSKHACRVICTHFLQMSIC